MRWPWRRNGVNGEPREPSAAQAKSDAQRRLDEQMRRWPEVYRASDQFAALVERALRGTR